MSDKIVLNLEIDNDENFNQTIGTIFKNLTDTQKEELALKSLLEFFNVIEPAKFYDYEKKIITAMRDASYFSYRDEKDVRASTQFMNMMKDLGSTKEGMLNIIKHDVMEYAKTIISDHVKNDTDIKAMIDLSLKELDTNIVKLINEAVARHIADTIGSHMTDFRKYVYDNITNFNNGGRI